jgi:hypothetical protein
MSGPGILTVDVAIKLLRPDVDPFGDPMRGLREEGKQLAALHHPVIARPIDIVGLEGRAGVVAEFVDGASVATIFREVARPPPSVLVEVIGALAGALDACWNTSPLGYPPLHLVHRDLKPSNICIARGGQVKLLDFGLTRADELTRVSGSLADSVIGSPAYMAPERLLEPDLRPESDVFALGCCLFEGLVGERFHLDAPVRRLTTLALDKKQYAAHLQQRLQAIPPGTSADLLELLRKLLSYRADLRGTAAEVVAACDALREAWDGVSLARWARERDWTELSVIAGEFDGKTLVETPPPPRESRPLIPKPAAPGAGAGATPATPAAAPVTPEAPLAKGKPSAPPVRRPATPTPVSRRWPAAVVQLGGNRRGLLVAVGALGVGVVAVAGAAAWRFGAGDAPAAAEVVETVAHGAEPGAHGAEPGAHGAEPATHHVGGQPPAVAAEASPHAHEGDVHAAPASKAPPAAKPAPTTARVLADLQGFTVWADGAEGRHELGETLAPGAYTLIARVPSTRSIVRLTPVWVAGGDTLRVSCKPAAADCMVKLLH